MEQVILVDPHDVEVGVEDKLRAHQDGALHRALSVFLFNRRGEVLLQRRAFEKYHSGGLWSNTCCSHPRPGEATHDAAHRRLREEMQIDCELQHAFQFTYHAHLDRGLIEHELDHVYVGRFDGEPTLDPAEAVDARWVGAEQLRSDVARRPEAFTYWFKLILERAFEHAPA